MKRIITLKLGLTLGIFLIAVFAFAQISYAQEPTLDELKKDIEVKNEELKKLEEEAEKYRQGVSEHQERGQNLKAEIARINGIIAQINRDIAVTEKKLNKTELEITALGIEINEKETSIKKLKAGLAGLIQILFERQKESLFATLFKNRLLSDFFRQLDSYSYLEGKILGSVENLRNLQKELSEEKKDAEGKKKEEEGLRQTLKGRQSASASEKNTRQQILNVTQNQEKKYQQLLQDQEKKIAALEIEIRDIESKIQVTIDPSSLPDKGSGVLAWPLPQVTLKSCKSLKEALNCITQFFGYTSFAAVGAYSGKGHNGVDFRAAYGTRVNSAENGVVVGVGDTDIGCRGASYGKWILIRHNNNLSTLYAHLSAIGVYAGQEIIREQQIGLTGQTGYATGPHLHFSVFASKAVRVDSVRSKVCGRLMTLPISALNGYLNPLDYL